MTLQSRVQAGLAAALNNPDKLGSISFTFDYKHPVSGAKASGRGYSLNIVEGESDSESIQVIDMTCNILQNELAVVPEIDGILTAKGIEFVISKVDYSSANIRWKITAQG